MRWLYNILVKSGGKKGLRFINIRDFIAGGALDQFILNILVKMMSLFKTGRMNNSLLYNFIQH